MEDPSPPLAIQSRIQQLTEIRSNCANLIAPDEEDLLRESVLQLQGKFTQIIGEYSDVTSLQPQDKDTYLENLKGELSSLEAEYAKLSEEVENLTTSYSEDSLLLQSKIEEQMSALEFIQSQGLETRGEEYQLASEGAHGDSKFKILELNSQIEKGKGILESLENLDYTRKRLEGFVKLEDTLTGLEVIEYDGNRISLSIRTFVPEIEMAEQNHELSIELLDGTLELKNAEIFPNDVYIDEIIDAAKSIVYRLSLLPMSMKNSLEWFVQRVQEKIVLTTLRKSLVKAASKSRHLIEYVDKDEIIIAYLMDGVEACIKVSQGWPITSLPLRLLSLKASSQSSKEVTFSFLCKVEERVNFLDVQVCQNLSTFVDAIEEIYRERMRVEIQSDSSINK